MKEVFEELSTIYTAIGDLDILLKSSSNEKIDDVMNYIKGIDRTKIDLEIQDRVVASIKEALINMYHNKLKEINNAPALTNTTFRTYEPAKVQESASQILERIANSPLEGVTTARSSIVLDSEEDTVRMSNNGGSNKEAIGVTNDEPVIPPGIRSIIDNRFKEKE